MKKKILETGNKPRQAMAFTLLEMLVVVFILSITVSMLPLNISRQGQKFKTKNEAYKLIVFLESARNYSAQTVKPIVVTRQHAQLSYIKDSRTISFNSPFVKEIRIKSIEETTTNFIVYFPNRSSSGGKIEALFDDHKVEVEISSLTGNTKVF